MKLAIILCAVLFCSAVYADVAQISNDTQTLEKVTVIEVQNRIETMLHKILEIHKGGREFYLEKEQYATVTAEDFKLAFKANMSDFKDTLDRDINATGGRFVEDCKYCSDHVLENIVDDVSRCVDNKKFSEKHAMTLATNFTNEKTRSLRALYKKIERCDPLPSLCLKKRQNKVEKIFQEVVESWTRFTIDLTKWASNFQKNIELCPKELSNHDTMERISYKTLDCIGKMTEKGDEVSPRPNEITLREAQNSINVIYDRTSKEVRSSLTKNIKIAQNITSIVDEFKNKFEQDTMRLMNIVGIELNKYNGSVFIKECEPFPKYIVYVISDVNRCISGKVYSVHHKITKVEQWTYEKLRILYDVLNKLQECGPETSSCFKGHQNEAETISREIRKKWDKLTIILNNLAPNYKKNLETCTSPERLAIYDTPSNIMNKAISCIHKKKAELCFQNSSHWRYHNTSLD